MPSPRARLARPSTRGSGFTAALFVLATEVWQGVPFGVWRLVGATLLGVMGPLGTWDMAKHYKDAIAKWPTLFTIV
jgi:hypothetical protein